MIETLREIRRLLLANGFPGQAEVVERLLHLNDENPTEFVRLLTSADMWGGSGAVWEVGDLGNDERAFRDAIISLAGQMDRADLGSERSRSTASTFRQWNRNGI
jgi:hypothetical protein